MKSFIELREESDSLQVSEKVDIKGALKKRGIVLKGSMLSVLAGLGGKELDMLVKAVNAIRPMVEEADLELTEGVEKLMKHPMMKGLKKPKTVTIDDDLSGEKIPMLDFGKFRVGEDAGLYYIETKKGYAVLTDLTMTQLAPAVAGILRMEGV